MTIKVIQGNCKTIAPTLSYDAIVSDPPYGMNNNCNYKRFSGSIKENNTFPQIENDNKPFDPSWMLDCPKVALFGYPHFASKLPLGTLLVWIKKRESCLGKFLSDAEIAWMKGGKGIYCLNHEWHGFLRASERGEKTLHPTQKPVKVMEWVIEKLKLPKGSTILDPYCGSGSTLLAARNLGFDSIGIEISEIYVDIAKERSEEPCRAC